MNSEKQQICSRFVKPEKLADLRTKREVEIMNGRPWTRELPPPPVLPPYSTLQKISGNLESFSYEKFREYFDVKAYRTSTVAKISDVQRGAAAALAITVGSPGAGGAIMAASESANSSAEYVQGVINGKPFRGWVGVTRVRTGDYVEMVVEWQHDHYEVYAIALPDEQIVSICPECDMGHIAHMLWRIKNMFILTGSFLFFVILMGVIDEFIDGSWEGLLFFTLKYKLLYFIMMLIGGVISSLIAFSAYKACAPTRCKLAEEIFKLLEMKNVAYVNLKKVTKKREWRERKEKQWCDPSNQLYKPKPTRKFGYSFEYWYYYR